MTRIYQVGIGRKCTHATWYLGVYSLLPLKGVAYWLDKWNTCWSLLEAMSHGTNASYRSRDTSLTYKWPLELNWRPFWDRTACKKSIQWWYHVRSSGKNNNNVILFGHHAGTLPRAAVTTNNTLTLLECHLHVSRLRHYSWADIPVWRPTNHIIV